MRVHCVVTFLPTSYDTGETKQQSAESIMSPPKTQKYKMEQLRKLLKNKESVQRPQAVADRSAGL